MKLRRVEDNTESLTVQKTLSILESTLKDYINASDNILSSVLKDWEEVKEIGNEESTEALPITVPISTEDRISISLVDLDLEIDKDLDISKYADSGIHLTVKNNKMHLSLNMPKLKDLLEYFKKDQDYLMDLSLIKEAGVSTENQVQQFATSCKEFLDQYTTDLQTIMDKLIIIDSASYIIYKILKKEK